MTRHRTVGRVASLAVEAVSVWLQHRLIEPRRGRPGLPHAMHYISTHRCNARCVMCGIWKETGSRDRELSPDELDAILGDRLFSAMEYVGISGGEPFLRDDLVDLCRVVTDRCPKVKRISLTTNGLLTPRMAAMLPEIADRCAAAGAAVDVSVSVHGLGEALDRIYGVERSFDRIERTADLLHNLRADGRISFSMNCVLLADNLDAVGELREWTAARDIPLSFVIGEHRLRFRTDGLDEAFVADGDRQRLVGFLRELAEDGSESAASALKYREIADMLDNRARRTLACYYAMGGLLLGYDGALYYCSHSKRIGDCSRRSPSEIYLDADNLAYRTVELLDAECRGCPPYTRTRWEIEKDLPRVVAESLRRRMTRTRRRGEGGSDRTS